MLVSIIIPVYFRTEWLKKCLSALSRQEGVDNSAIEVLVIDDGSPNAKEIEKITAEFQNKLDVSYFYQKRSGPAAAKNLGINKSKGEIICFIDDDSICDKYWLANMIREFKKDNSVGIASGKILSYNQETGSFGLLLQQAVYKPKKRWATSNIAYRRESLQRIGIFDENYKLASWEDNDLGFRAWVRGIRHIYCPGAIVYHSHEEDISGFWEKSLRNGYGLGEFARKFFFSYPIMVIGIIMLVIRDLYLIFHPNVFLARKKHKEFLRFIWAFNSLRGSLEVLLKWKPELLKG